jgi:hypothetical protein
MIGVVQSYCGTKGMMNLLVDNHVRCSCLRFLAVHRSLTVFGYKGDKFMSSNQFSIIFHKAVIYMINRLFGHYLARADHHDIDWQTI